MEEQVKNDLIDIIKNLSPLEKEEDIKERKHHLIEFLKTGFPNKRMEDWKFSDLKQIISSNIKELKFFDNNLDNAEYDQSNILNFEHNKIIFTNGLVSKIDFCHEEKARFEVMHNITETNTKKISRLHHGNEFANTYVAGRSYETEEKNPLILLNNGLKFTHIRLQVKKNYEFKKPLVVYNFTNQKLKSTAINLRFDIELKKNSFLKMINLFNDDSDNNFININHQYKICDNAVLKNYKIDHKNNSNIKYFYNNIDLGKNSITENFIFSTGSKFLKNEINCNLNDEYSSAFINGILNLKESKHHEIKTNINHRAANTKSYQLVKSVLNDNSKGVYQGKIYVSRNAQKTDGYQLSKALLLSENTEFDAKPELEIYADDVKCSHGSTSGNLDEEAIFYFMSRGLNYKQSRELLINGFLLDVVEKITDSEIKDLIKNIMGIKEWV